MAITRLVSDHPQLADKQTAAVFDDFFSYTDAQMWTKYSKGGSGSLAWSNTALSTNSGASTSVLATTAATAWDVEGIYSTNAMFLPLALNAGMYAECYMSSTGVHAAGSSMHYFGLCSTHVISSGANTDPTASFSGALVYKLSGDTYWRTQSSNGATKTTTISNQPVVEGANLLRIDIVNLDGLNAKVSYHVNNAVLKDSNNIQISHVMAYSGLVAMGLNWQVESDTNASAQTAYLDYIAGGLFRSLLNQ